LKSCCYTYSMLFSVSVPGNPFPLPPLYCLVLCWKCQRERTRDNLNMVKTRPIRCIPIPLSTCTTTWQQLDSSNFFFSFSLFFLSFRLFVLFLVHQRREGFIFPFVFFSVHQFLRRKENRSRKAEWKEDKNIWKCMAVLVGVCVQFDVKSEAM